MYFNIYMSLTNPFAKPAPKKNIPFSKPIQKNDSTRENVKKQLINALEKAKDNLLQDLKLTSEEIAKEIEEEVFKQNDDSSRSKAYRDKIRKLEMRIKGPRNNFIREILKKGLLSVIDFCNLNDKDLMDENYFKKLEGNKTDKNEQKALGEENNSKNNNIPPKKISSSNRIAKPPQFKNFMIPKPQVIHDKDIKKNINNQKEILSNNNNDNDKKEMLLNNNNNNDNDKKEILLNNNNNDNDKKEILLNNSNNDNDKNGILLNNNYDNNID